MSVAGIIFSNIHDNNLSELTHNRTMASVPFGCRYRLIDFTLSNMVNSGISNIYVITHFNYQSLMDHLGSGKDWDLARRQGGIKILPPFITAYANGANALYQTRLEALKSVNQAIERMQDEFVVLSDCDIICNFNLKEMVENHVKSGADITIATKDVHMSRENARKNAFVRTDEDGRIRDMLVYPTDFSGHGEVSLNMMVMRSSLLKAIVTDAIAHGYNSFNRDVLMQNLDFYRIRAYHFDGFFASVNSMEEYYANQMELISSTGIQDAIFRVPNRPIYTKVRNSAPTYYGDNASVSDSLIADGCTILGTVEHSILFRGVKVGAHTVVRDSILFQDTFTGDNVSLHCVITDKNVVIRDGCVLSGDRNMPFYISKGKMV